MKAYLMILAATILPLILQAQPRQKGYAPVNGLNIYYEIHGSGEPIVLLHGAYMSIDMNWSQVIPELSKTRKVIALELQGHGRTADADRPFSYLTMAEDVAAVMNHLQVDSADVFGYSMGGVIAIQLAIAHPQKVNRLIVVSAPYRYDGWQPEVRDMFKTFQPEFFDSTPLMTEYKRLAPDSSLWHAFVRKMITFDQDEYNLGEENIRNIQSPTLLIKGDNDGISLEHIDTFYRLLGGSVFGDVTGLPASQLAIVPGKTHVGLLMEPAEVMSIINRFLNSPKK